MRRKKDKDDESPQEKRAAESRMRGRLNKATEPVQPEEGGLAKIRKKIEDNDRKKGKGKK
jgi:hypothetical protein